MPRNFRDIRCQGEEWRRGGNHLDIATNSTDEISKNVQPRKSARMRAFSKLKMFGYFIVEFVAVSLGDGGGECNIYIYILVWSRHKTVTEFHCT